MIAYGVAGFSGFYKGPVLTVGPLACTCAWRIVISPATGHVNVSCFPCLTSHLSASNWMSLILKAPRVR